MNPTQWLHTPLVARLVETLGHFLWQAAAVAVVVLTVTWALRRTSAHVRYLALLTGLLVMISCPVVTFCLLETPPTPIEPTTVAAPSTAVPEINLTPPAKPPTIPAVDPSETTPLSPPIVPVPPADAVASPAIEGPAGAPVGDEVAASPQESVQTEAPAAGVWQIARPWVAIAYLLGVLLMLGRVLVGVSGGQRLRRDSRIVEDPNLLATVARQAKALGLRIAPAVAYCARVATPVVVGILRPVILLPLNVASGLSPEQLQSLLTHELAHVRRYDHLINFLQRLVEAVLFFHPAVWLVSRRIRIEREHCCDDRVVALGSQALLYADSLVRMAEMALADSPVGTAALGAAGQPSQLGRRIMRLVAGPDHPRVRLGRSGTVAMGLVLSLALIGTVYLHAQPSPPSPEPVTPGVLGASEEDPDDPGEERRAAEPEVVEAPTGSFGPVEVRQVNFTRDQRKDSLIDLDTGRLFRLPGRDVFANERDRLAWMASRGIDASGDAEGGGLVGVNMIAVQVRVSRFNALLLATVRRTLATHKPARQVAMSLPKGQPRGRAVYFVKTREGGIGVVELSQERSGPFRDEGAPRPGVRVRYKMLPGTTQPAPRVSTTQAAKWPGGSGGYREYRGAVAFLAGRDRSDAPAPRAKAVAGFAAVANRFPDSRYGKMAAELARMLERMAIEDAAFKEPADPDKLTVQQRIDYLVHNLRDVAARAVFVPGKCRVLRHTSPPDNVAMALRKIGKPAVPTLLGLLDDERPTRSVDGAMNGGHLVRYCDVALELLEAMSGRTFDARSRRGSYLATANPVTRRAIVESVHAWWEANKDKTESQWLREAMTDTGVGPWVVRLDQAERLVELQGEASADFFISRLAKEPDNPHVLLLLGSAGGPKARDALRPLVRNENLQMRATAYRALARAGEPGVAEAVTAELGRVLNLGPPATPDEAERRRKYIRSLIWALLGPGRKDGIIAALGLLHSTDPVTRQEAFTVFHPVSYKFRKEPHRSHRGLVLPHMASLLDTPDRADSAAIWIILAYELPIPWAKDPKVKQKAVQQVKTWCQK